MLASVPSAKKVASAHDFRIFCTSKTNREACLNMYKYSSLSRLSITGPINLDTPLCVLLEIADAHGIAYAEADVTHYRFHASLLELIENTSTVTLSANQENQDWGHIARYVAHTQAWTAETLQEAFVFLQKFQEKVDPLVHIPKDVQHWGCQTPTSVYSLNACVAYKICRYHALPLTSQTTLPSQPS